MERIRSAELRAAPADAILAAAPGLGFRPIVDGWFLPRSPAEIFVAGEQSDVPLMAGWNKDEGFNFTLLQGDDAKRPYAELVRAIFGERTEAALRLYAGGSPEADAASARALGGDLAIIHPTWAWIEARSESGRADICRFRFDRAPLTPQGWFGERDGGDAGAFHAGELLYVFDNLHAYPWLIDDADRALAKLTSSYWINFIANGDPNGAGLPRWPSYATPRPGDVSGHAPRGLRNGESGACSSGRRRTKAQGHRSGSPDARAQSFPSGARRPLGARRIRPVKDLFDRLGDIGQREEPVRTVRISAPTMVPA